MSHPQKRPDEPLAPGTRQEPAPDPQAHSPNGGSSGSSEEPEILVGVKPKVPVTRKASPPARAKRVGRKTANRPSTNGGSPGSAQATDVEPRSKDVDASTFTRVFYAMLSIVIFSLLSCLILALFADQTETVKTVLDMFINVVKMSIGSFLGLLAGRITTVTRP